MRLLRDMAAGLADLLADGQCLALMVVIWVALIVAVRWLGADNAVLAAGLLGTIGAVLVESFLRRGR